MTSLIDFNSCLTEAGAILSLKSAMNFVSYMVESENFLLTFSGDTPKPPLPWREGMKGRGIRPVLSTPTSILPHRRGRSFFVQKFQIRLNRVLLLKTTRKRFRSTKLDSFNLVWVPFLDENLLCKETGGKMSFLHLSH
jgi:hypothetical protein